MLKCPAFYKRWASFLVPVPQANRNYVSSLVISAVMHYCKVRITAFWSQCLPKLSRNACKVCYKTDRHCNFFEILTRIWLPVDISAVDIIKSQSPNGLSLVILSSA